MMEKSSFEYWESAWTSIRRRAPAVTPSSRSYSHWMDRHFDKIFRDWFNRFGLRGQDLIEVGCGNSKWLPYFHRFFDCRVAGMDYSPKGCELARSLLARESIAGEILEANLFSPPATARRRYDILVSMGVVEHFEDTAQVIRALPGFLKEDGFMITEVPNLSGLWGHVQKRIGPEIYDIHVPMTREDLVAAHRAA